MGYESYVEGTARGKNLVEQLLQMGFAIDGADIRAPNRHYTGLKVVDEQAIAGTEEWGPAYGFDELVEALHRVEDLAHAHLIYEGEEGDDCNEHIFFGGRWYSLLQVEVCVEEGTHAAAREAAMQALAPFALPADAKIAEDEFAVPSAAT